MINIFFRVCDKIDAVNGLKRPFGLDKKSIIKSCFKSLLKSLNQTEYKIYIIGDSIASDTDDSLKQISEQYKNEYHNFEYILENSLGNKNSLLLCYERADKIRDDGLIYFCEDDYLHNDNSFLTCLNAFLETYNSYNFVLPFFIHPSDYPDQYHRLFSRNYIIQTKFGYWREVNSTTCTFLLSTKAYHNFSNFLKSCNVNDAELSSIFRKEAMCFSPVPGIATHMHEGVMSNYVDWSKML